MSRDDRHRYTSASVGIPVGAHWLQGDLGVPAEPQGLVLFAHGGGSDRRNPRSIRRSIALPSSPVTGSLGTFDVSKA